MFQGIFRQLGPGADDISSFIRKDASKNLSDIDFIAIETINWLDSKQRKLQLRGTAYYDYDQDILNRDKSCYTTDNDGAPVPVNDRRNCSHMIDNQYANMVDQKINYILGKPFSLQTDNENYTNALNLVFDKYFKRMLHNMAIDTLNGGLAWVQPYFNEQGELNFKRFPAYEIYPFWSDDEHTILDMAIRYYTTITYIDRNPTTIEHVEVFSKDGIKRYILSGGKLIIDKDNPETAYALTKDKNNVSIPLSWDKIPLIAFKYNQHEIPLIKRIKSLQDAINDTRSNWQDNMNEDIRDTIWVIKNFDGENIAEFRQKIMKYGAVKVNDNGGIDALRIERDTESYTSYLKETKRALIENARGFDAKDDRVGTNPNEMNLRSMYSDIDLDADEMEIQFQASFDQLLWFVDKYLQNAGLGDFSKEDVKITFDRNMIVNDSESINNVKNSVGIVSDETLLAHHPFVSDVQAELERLKKQNTEENNNFGQYQQLGSDDNGKR